MFSCSSIPSEIDPLAETTFSPLVPSIARQGQAFKVVIPLGTCLFWQWSSYTKTNHGVPGRKRGNILAVFRNCEVRPHAHDVVKDVRGDFRITDLFQQKPLAARNCYWKWLMEIRFIFGDHQREKEVGSTRH